MAETFALTHVKFNATAFLFPFQKPAYTNSTTQCCSQTSVMPKKQTQKTLQNSVLSYCSRSPQFDLCK